MKPKFFALLALIFSFFTTFSQNYHPGYIVLVNNDTLSGFLKPIDLEAYPRKIEFKYDKNSNKKIIFKIQQIRAFKIADNKYIVAYVKLDETGIDKDNLPLFKDIKFTYDTVVLQVLIEGEKSFYTMPYKGKDLFFIGDKNSIVLLEAPMYIEIDSTTDPALARVLDQPTYQYSKYIKYSSNIKQLITYRYQLYEFLGDCDYTYKQIFSAQYNLYYLYNIIKSYYTNCLHKRPKYLYKMPKPVFDYGILAGAISNQMYFVSSVNYFNYLTNVNFNPSFSYYVGTYFQFTPWQYQYRVSFLFNTALYNLYTSGIGVIYNENTNQKISIQTILNMQFIDLYLGFKYAFIIKPLDVGVQLGISYSIPYKFKSTVYNRFMGSDSILVFDGFYSIFTNKPLVKSEVGFNLGIFAQYKRIGLNVYFVRTEGFMNPMWLSQTDVKLVTTLTYSFSKR